MIMAIETCSRTFVEDLIDKQPEGDNTKFLKSAHNLWFRFHNYGKQDPFVLRDGEEPVALVFITFSSRSKYANLYEIVTLEGKEGNGYAGDLFEQTMARAYDLGKDRLKISCTPSSVTWHKRNGLIFWAVDPSGSLRADQPIFPNRHEQLTFRELALKDRSIALPPTKVIEQLQAESLESHGFGEKKTAKVQQAIQDVGEYWFRDALFETSSLEAFL